MTDPRQRRRSRLPRVKKSDEDPKLIGHWKIGRTIGKGSSGRVKIARHVNTHQYAAIKIVSKTALLNSRISMMEAPAQVEKVLLCIEREIVIMKLIDHPNVLNLYDVWETTNELYLIMEYVEGGELFDYLVSRGRIDVAEALHYFQQIISAISYCHGFNIAHRGTADSTSSLIPCLLTLAICTLDLKPENLLLSKSSTRQNIKVADFGMAAYTDPTALLSTSCGSPHYASPEVVEGKSYKGNVSDIWSCGVILYALLVGRLPFDHESIRILLEKVKMATYDTPKDVPAAARDLISRMLEKDVTKRITMSQILQHPFFLSTAPSPHLLLSVQNPTLDVLSSKIQKPVHNEDDIDADIFDNMRTLWHGVPISEIIHGLLNDEKTWEKAVYYLLLKYRSKHLENYNMEKDEEDQPRQRQHLKTVHKRLLSVVQSSGVEEPGGVSPEQEQANVKEQTIDTMSQSPEEPTYPIPAARPTAPTPERAVGQRGTIFMQRDIDDTPLEACVISSPTASSHPALETDTDVFTATPRREPTPTAIPGPSPLLLRNLPGLTVIDPPILPLINLQEATPMRLEEQILIQSDRCSTASSSPGPSPILGLPGIVIPNLDNVDETVQRFFHQIVEHLNNMQMWQSSASASTRSSSATPDFSIKEEPGMYLAPRLGPQNARTIARNQATLEPPDTMAEHDPDEVRFQDATEESEISPDLTTDSEALGLGISDCYHRVPPPVIRPPLQQQQLRPPPPGRAYTRTRCSTITGKRSYATEDKENIRVQKGVVESKPLQLLKKSSLRSSGEKRKNLGDKRVHILVPSQETEGPEPKPKKSILSTQSGAYEPHSPPEIILISETSPALSDGSFFLPAGMTPRRSWFANLFNFKPASYNLLSIHDAYTTKEECARVLRGFGVAVLTDVETSHVLKCKLDEIRDPVGTMGLAKAVRFRVELHNVTHAHSVSGYETSLTMVQEKGALSSFKLVYNRLRREWDLDTPPTATRATSAVY